MVSLIHAWLILSKPLLSDLSLHFIYSSDRDIYVSLFHVACEDCGQEISLNMPAKGYVMHPNIQFCTYFDKIFLSNCPERTVEPVNSREQAAHAPQIEVSS